MSTNPFFRSTEPEATARRGRVTAFLGCMFSGKTTQLLTGIGGSPPGTTLLFKPALDARYQFDAVVSHAGLRAKAVPVAHPEELWDHLSPDTRTVGIDEAHFFPNVLLDVVNRLAEQRVNVIVTSLDRDSWGRPFPVIDNLVELADVVRVMHARCARCRGVANRTQRLTPILNGHMVGGPESYEPRCELCWRPPPEDPPPHAFVFCDDLPPSSMDKGRAFPDAQQSKAGSVTL